MRIGDSALCYKAVNRKSTPRWRGPAKILDINETGVTSKFQSRTFKDARYCVGKKEETTDAEEVDGNPASDQWGKRDGVS